jgi:hypothetical protein
LPFRPPFRQRRARHRHFHADGQRRLDHFKNSPRLDGSYGYNLKVAKLADEMGLDFIMAMAKFKGYGGEIQH